MRGRFFSLRLSLVFATAMFLAAGADVVDAQPSTDFVPVTDVILQDPPPGDWLMWRRTLNGWGYSSLEQVTPQNVAELRLIWSRALSFGASQQGTPLVYDGIMYMPNPRDVIQAIDAVTGPPITYAVDGRQYVAVSIGSASAASAFTRLTPELRPSAGNNLFVFALPN